MDESGVALATIRGLNQKVETRTGEVDERVRRLESENAELKSERRQTTKLVEALTQHRSGTTVAVQRQ